MERRAMMTMEGMRNKDMQREMDMAMQNMGMGKKETLVQDRKVGSNGRIYSTSLVKQDSMCHLMHFVIMCNEF